MANEETPKHNRKFVDWKESYFFWLTPTLWGWLLTAAVISGICIYYKYYPNAFDSLKSGANNFGDFIAGTAGSLALVWLIVGYYLQRQEVKRNTNALYDQKDELEKQVKATNEMAIAMLRMAKSNESLVKFYESTEIKQEREKIEQAKPIFRCASGGSVVTGGTRFEIENAGESVTNLLIDVITPNVDYHKDLKPFFDNKNRFILTWKPDNSYEWPLEFSVQYEDKYGNKFIEFFEMHPRHQMSQVSKEYAR